MADSHSQTPLPLSRNCKEMATKRLFCETEPCPDQPPEKRRPRHTFASIIGEVVMVNSLKHLSKALEPLLRRVVNEEVDRCLMRYSRSLARSSSLRIQALEPPSLQLVFTNKLCLPIFTGSKITDVEGQQLRLSVVDATGVPASPLSPSLKVEIVVLDGDFPAGDLDDWTSEEFTSNIVKERSGRRPLLHGDMNITLRHGAATVGDLEFTDNSSWIRSRKFRLAARLVSGSDRDKGDIRIREAISEPFVVRDHRGELYKKHYPPMLHDHVWRLEKIGKEGVFHRKLANHGIDTVQEFLKLAIIDPQKLRAILGVGMSERMWEATVKHAKTCELGNKLYLYRDHNIILFLNPVCEVVRTIINGQMYTSRDIGNISEEFIKNLRREAYDSWNSLQEFEGNSREFLLLTQGNERGPSYENEDSEYIIQGSMIQSRCELISEQVDCHNWDSNMDPSYTSTTIQGNFQYNCR